MSKLDPRQTLITLPDEIRWQVPDVAPRRGWRRLFWRAPSGRNAALRRGAARGSRTRGHRGHRNWPGQTGLGGPRAAAAAATISGYNAALDVMPRA